MCAELAELLTLRGKNQDVVAHMMERVRQEKESFERGLQRFTALRTVFSEQTNKLFDEIGQEALRQSFPRPPGEGATDRAILTRAIVYIPDVLEDSQYQFQPLAQASGLPMIGSVSVCSQ